MGGKRNRKIGYRQIFLIICTAFWVFYPFIARVLVNKVSETEQQFFSTSEGYVIDILLYCKELALIGFIIFAFVYFLGERIFPDHPIKIDPNRLKRLKYPFIFIGGYALFSILSFIFSDYKDTALFGVNSEYEGFLVILGYVGLFLFALFFMKKEPNEDIGLRATDILKYGIIILCLIIGILSIIEVFWKPILEFEFMQDLISSEKTREIAHSLKNENFIGQISLTFNNPGFLGGFCALFIPVNFSISLEAKKIWRILAVIGTGMMGLSIFWSSSNVAIISLAISMPVLILCVIKKERKNKKPDFKSLLKSFSVTLGIAVFLIVLSKVLPTYSSRVRPEGGSSTSVSGQEVFRLKKAEIKNGELYLYSENDTLLCVSVDQDLLHKCYLDDVENNFSECLVFSDGKNEIQERTPAVVKATNIREAVNGFKFTDERYSAITIATDNLLLIMDLGYTGTVEFAITEKGIKAFGQKSNLLDEIPQPAVTGLESFYKFGTGRGYIWVQSLPVLKDSLLIGGGNGTFAFRFRQNEMVGLLNTHGSFKYVVDRPHNWYLQIACSDGVPALIFVLALFIWYLIRFIKRLGFRNKNDIEKTKTIISIEHFEIGLFAGLIGFMLCGFINDSCITVNPWFWILLGTAVAFF